MIKSSPLQILLVGFTLAIWGSAAAKQYSVLWIGNSLTTASMGCAGQGQYEATNMMNKDSARTGISIRSQSVIAGATDLSGHWHNGYALQEIGAPSLSGVDRYDYVVLQGYNWWSAAVRDSGYKYGCKFADTIIARGSKPVFFCCWQGPGTMNATIAIYDSLYEKYKGDGALLAPVFQAHSLVWAERDSITYLYGFDWGTDPYHHENERGVYLNAGVFYAVFTGMNPGDFDFSLLTAQCPDLEDTLVAQHDFIESKAWKAYSDYYKTTGVDSPIRLHAPAARWSSLVSGIYDLYGRRMRSHANVRGMAIIQDKQGPCLKTIAGNR
jgi:hypothetical protein